MSEEEILIGNAKVAEFMGLKYFVEACENDYVEHWWSLNKKEITAKPWGQTWCFASPPPFDESWAWLMPVVEKIESLFKESLIFIIKANKCYIEMDTQLTMAYDDLPDVPECYSGHCESKIKAAFSTVLQFIDWYNTNVPENKPVN